MVCCDYCCMFKIYNVHLGGYLSIIKNYINTILYCTASLNSILKISSLKFFKKIPTLKHFKNKSIKIGIFPHTSLHPLNFFFPIDTSALSNRYFSLVNYSICYLLSYPLSLLHLECENCCFRLIFFFILIMWYFYIVQRHCNVIYCLCIM